MKIKKFITAMAVTAFSVLSVATMAFTAYGADINIQYTQSDNALTTSDDTNEVRLNICNTWSGNSIEDIKSDTPVSEKIVVNFTVDGIGSDSTRTNEDGTTEDLCAYLIGSIGSNSAWNAEEDGNETVAINGDGDYTVTWTLDEDSESIDSLILQSNIRIDAETTLEDSGITLTINYISTVGDEEETTTTTTESTTTTAAATTSATTTSAPIANAPAPTGDTGMGVAVSVMALAGVAVVVSKKKNN
ncbi:MAG: NPXTG-anchored protein [Ruminococcus flavefaciens]|nr:NPXTG-anchored protein [Ruminococcus flavefaciens]